MLEPGTVVAGYRIQRLLGSGGMGAVYLAAHPELPRSDALKVLSSSGGASHEQFRLRFLREAEAAAKLDHSNVVTVFTRGRAVAPGGGDLLWIAMQYIPGTDCARALSARGRIDARLVSRIVSETARGIDHAHRKGLLHRDIKPANILLAETDDGDEQRVVLTDFGVAKFTDETSGLTSAGTVLATLSYASPEQLSGAKLDGRTDQYSLAATAFHLLTGRVPFDDADTSAVIKAHLHEPVPSASRLVPGLPTALDAVIAKAMAKNRDARFGSSREFADAFGAALRTPSSPPAARRARPGPVPAGARPGPPVAGRVAPRSSAAGGDRAGRPVPQPVRPGGMPGAPGPGFVGAPRSGNPYPAAVRPQTAVPHGGGRQTHDHLAPRPAAMGVRPQVGPVGYPADRTGRLVAIVAVGVAAVIAIVVVIVLVLAL